MCGHQCSFEVCLSKMTRRLYEDAVNNVVPLICADVIALLKNERKPNIDTAK